LKVQRVCGSVSECLVRDDKRLRVVLHSHGRVASEVRAAKRPIYKVIAACCDDDAVARNGASTAILTVVCGPGVRIEGETRYLGSPGVALTVR